MGHKCLICTNEPQSFLKIPYSENPPTWNSWNWLSRWGQLMWVTILDCLVPLWPGTVNWPLHKSHTGFTELLNISKLWHGFKITPILADLWYLSQHRVDASPQVNYRCVFPSMEGHCLSNYVLSCIQYIPFNSWNYLYYLLSFTFNCIHLQ